MALYEYVCRACDTSFEVRRAIGDVERDVACPNGHTEVRRKFSVFAAVGASPSGASAPVSVPSGGGCCGGGCGCAH